MAQKFNVDTIAYKVDAEKIKSGKTDVYLKSFSGKGNGAVVELPLDLIDDFPNHPFRVLDDEDMQKLVESIKENGVITPITVREKEDGRYELISGHRRRRASLLAGRKTIPGIISNITEEEAVIAMVDANLQREKILPSEKAFAYKMKLEAMKRQGKRTDLTSTQVVSKLRSGDIVGENNGDSREQVRRYVRLTYLVPGLLEMVDSGKMPFVVGVELSYLNTEEQLTLAEIIKKSPSLAQASELKQLSKANILTAETIKRTLYPPKELDDVLDFEDKYEQLTLDDVEPGREKKKAASSKDKNINALVDELKKKHCATVHNWSGDENQVMKGYILKAFNMWNLSNPEDAIPKETLDNLMQALRWATDELTAEQAYEYYMTH